MSPRFVSFFLLLILYGSYCDCASGKEEEKAFPFSAEIIDDKVNVRAGPNINFEELCQLNKASEVVVTARSFEWYKIRLPDYGKCFISEKFVRPRFDNFAAVTGNRVNVRAGAGEKFTIIGQLAKNTRVKTKGQASGWYQIEPVDGVYGWVHEKFVVFKSNNVPSPKVVTEPSRSVYKKPADVPAAEKKDPEIFSVVGRIEDAGRIFSRDIHHKLIVDNKTVYFLEGDRTLLDRVIHFTVKVEGKIKPDPEKHHRYPVITVSKVNSML